MHPLLPSLVEAYVSSALAYASSPTHFGMSSSSTSNRSSADSLLVAGGSLPFTEEELLRQFSAEVAGEVLCVCAPAGRTASSSLPSGPLQQSASTDLTPQLLFFYYMLYIYDQELTARASDNTSKPFPLINFCFLACASFSKLLL